MHGPNGTIKHQDGTIYHGDFQNGKYNGHGTIVHPDGRSYTGGWAEGKQHGHGVQTLKCGKPVKGEWVEGKRITWVEELVPENHRGQTHKCGD